MKVVYSEKFLQHRNPFETRERLVAIKEYLDKNLKPEYVAPNEIPEEELLLCHSRQLVERVKSISRSGPIQFGDNFFQPNTFSIAKLSAGAAIKAAELSLKGFAFSLARPPGHHASREEFGGFCYFNNIALAVKWMQKRGTGKILIVDFDLHHGNGTQSIFLNDPSVFYFSLHQDPTNTYPFRGFEPENSGHIKNVVLKEGATDSQLLRLFETALKNVLAGFSPDMLAVSAGFDIFSRDFGIGNRLAVKNTATFNSIGRILKREFSGPAFAVLEGGYYLPTLGENVFQFLRAFG